MEETGTDTVDDTAIPHNEDLLSGIQAGEYAAHTGQVSHSGDEWLAHHCSTSNNWKYCRAGQTCSDNSCELFSRSAASTTCTFNTYRGTAVLRMQRKNFWGKWKTRFDQSVPAGWTIRGDTGDLLIQRKQRAHVLDGAGDGFHFMCTGYAIQAT